MPELLRTAEELEAFRPGWEALWREDASATPFQHPDWLLPWWHQFGRELRSVVVRRKGKPVAFLPLYVYTEPASRQRRLLMVGASTTDYLDGVFGPECAREDVSAALEFLRDEGGWDVMNVAQLRPDSLLARALDYAGADRVPSERCWRMRAVRISELPVKLRRNVMYYRNRAARSGALEFRMADAANWAEIFDGLASQHTARWRERGEPGVLADPRMAAWHREAIPRLQASGLLRLCCLRLNGQVLGAAYSVMDPAWRRKRTQYFYLHTYALEYAELRPGTLLLAFAMEHAAEEEGIEFIDLLRGDEGYKKIWRAEPVLTLGYALPAATLERGFRAA